MSSKQLMTSIMVGETTVKLLDSVSPDDRIGHTPTRDGRRTFRSWIGTVGDQNVELWPSNQMNGTRAGLQIGQQPTIWLKRCPITWQELVDTLEQDQIAA